MSGLDQSKLNKLEGAFIKRIEKKFEQTGDLSESQERMLEKIYRRES
jgi:hypothetical protein